MNSQLKKTASTYMAMASGMGLGQEKANDMAITLAGLSGDVASFYNISQELADIKIKSQCLLVKLKH